MSSFRIQVNRQNKSNIVETSFGCIGGTLIRAPKGPTELVYLRKGETKRARDIFGEPSPDYPDLYEMLFYLENFPLRVGAPVGSGAKFGGVFFRNSGVTPFTDGVASKEALISQGGAGTMDDVAFTVGTTDGSTQSFLYTISNFAVGRTYIEGTLKVTATTVGGVVTELAHLSSSVVGGVETFSLGIGETEYATGTLNLATGAIALSVTNVAIYGETGLTLKALLDFAIADFAFALISKAPQADDLSIAYEKVVDGTDTRLLITVYRKAGAVYSKLESWLVGFTQGEVDGYGRKLFITDVIDSDHIEVVYINTLSLASLPASTSKFDFFGGARGAAPTGADIASAYDQFKLENKNNVDLIWNNIPDTTVYTKLATLRTGFLTTVKFISCTSMLDVDEALSAFAAITAKNEGLSYYWNYGLISNTYNNNGNCWTALMGEIGVNHSRSIATRFGGDAIAWVNEDGFGGQLNSGRILEMKYDLKAGDDKLMDDACLNPVVFDLNFGPMILSRRSSYTGALSDFSFNDKVTVLDLILKDLFKNVLPYQIVKNNDRDHRKTVYDKTVDLLSPRTRPPKNCVYDYEVICDETNNDAEALDNEQFILTVGVKLTPKSRWIVVNLVNTNVGTEFDVVLR